MKICPIEVTLLDVMGNDNAVVDAARVSFSKDHSQYLVEQNNKLIHYLAKHKHWSPFSHCYLKFRIKAPVFVARQLAKHVVGLAWNEVSRRYVDEEPEFWFPDVWRGRPINAKQGSDGVVTELFHEPGHEDLWGDVDNKHHPTLHVQYATQCALDMYNRLLQSNVAPEQARMVLPQNTMTEWIWSGSLAAFARVCKLRLDPHAQQETTEVAEKIGNLTAERFPVSFAALMEN